MELLMRDEQLYSSSKIVRQVLFKRRLVRHFGVRPCYICIMRCKTSVTCLKSANAEPSCSPVGAAKPRHKYEKKQARFLPLP